jgi:Flp pilus assembly protein CpaB
MGRRWTRSSRGYLALSVALAAVAALIVHSYTSRLVEAEPAAGRERRVAVAAQQIVRGIPIRSQQLRLVSIPEAFSPPGTFSKLADVAGRVALSGLSAGEPVTETRLARVRAGPVASLVPQGLRAFAVPTTLPAGSVAAGDRVDVLATYGTGRPHTETVVDGVEVLLVVGAAPGGGAPVLGGAGRDAAASGASASTSLILLVSPYQQQRLAYARSFANLEVTIQPTTT